MSINEEVHVLVRRLREEKEKIFDCHQELGCGACVCCLNRRLTETERELEVAREARRAVLRDAVLTEAWLIERIDAELKREGLPALSWTDGGGSTCPTGWHRNPYLNSGKVASLTKALNDLLGFAERNWRRASAAAASAKVNRFDGTEFSEELRIERLVLTGREHEALRFFLVVRDRVTEALR